MKAKFITPLLLCFALLPVIVYAQNRLDFDGQLSLYGNYSPDNEMKYFAGGRYLPKLSYEIPMKSSRLFDMELAANIYGSASFTSFDSIATDGDIKAYRIWARYAGKQFEFRVGLQKIDFGSAMLLRPLQWFDEIDPRDPLKFTDGVYGALARYYFLNNANLWFWVLYGNENPRGFEIMKSNPKVPEFGGRLQYPVPRGEIALSYHHRNADSRDLGFVDPYENIPENRFGLDGKWDVEVGLWFEAAYIQKSKDVEMLTYQAYLEMGTDYTFALGNGLNVVVEHLIGALDEEAFTLDYLTNTTASMLTYPLGMFDNISAIASYSWDAKAFSVFLNYEHQFKHVAAYIMAFYNPEIQQNNIYDNEFENNFSGPGLRLMVVYNH